ncbi:hypothetical protein T4E_4925, partial [Trichinella pseudospiralis]
LVEANVADTDSQLLLDTDAAVNPTPLIREDLFGTVILRTATEHNYRHIIDEMLPSLEELNALRSVLWKYRRCIATSDEDLGHT